ncbi:carbohydrate-binding module family 1 protein [Aplosporella prunicola CBS 121167]|uniref:AA9 family lytic polysaccharide monooxygenase n=1 Tax=Aplosporella prunicola CBS 121167 TaxID=1176127 RepID=A0A6A6B6N2_9PEZI|nr:carbohydrate-binding module family 1 protein [Aplosporella prunicola CBS 121167]KAF2138451.1 carbohydrate-binding module family 1 protein [Aplosporella prunicola CBS 121167]
MKYSAIVALAAAAQVAQAHTTVFAAWINDKDQGVGNTAEGYIRSPPNNNPIKDVTSKDMTCNVNNVATAKTLKVKSGDKFTFEWHHDSRSDSDDIIASSHKGPVMTYIAPTEKGTAGSGWVKLAEDGYDVDTDTWAVDTLIKNKGKHSITIPNIAAGKYLLRPEIFALHEASNVGGIQVYTECVQIEVTSSGTTELPAGVSIPGIYKQDEDGVVFDIYSSKKAYPIPGPKVWDGASSSSSSGAVEAAAVSTPEASSTPAATPVAQSSAAAVSSPAAAATTPAAAAGGAVSTATEYSTTQYTTYETVTTGSTPAATPAADPTSAAAASPAASGSSSGSVKKYHQCGGKNYNGATDCEEGSKCEVQNDFYSQCI